MTLALQGAFENWRRRSSHVCWKMVMVCTLRHDCSNTAKSHVKRQKGKPPSLLSQSDSKEQKRLVQRGQRLQRTTVTILGCPALI
jgi:hypothetical protein